MSVSDPKTWFKYQTHIHKAKRSDDSGSKYPRPTEHDAYYNSSARSSAESRGESREIIPSTLPPYHPSSLPPFKDINTTATDNTREEVEASAPESEEPKPAVAEEPTTAKESAVGYLEKCWARPLSPAEYETVAKNLEEFAALGCHDLVIEAIRRADLNGKRTMKYIDSILLQWQKKGILTLAQVQEEDEEFQARKNKASLPGKVSKPSGPGGKPPSGKYDQFYL